MGKKFWLQFALNEALDVLMAYGANATQDPVLTQKMQTASSAIKDTLDYVISGQIKPT